MNQSPGNRAAIFAIAISGVVSLAACGSSSTAGSGASPASSPSAAASSPSTQASSPAATGTVVVKVATATVAGKSESILTNTAGLTLYYRTSDTATSVCSGGCASVWPPLLLPSGTPTSSDTLNGTLVILADANGSQVTYSGHPLYMYSNDTGPGSTKGEGFAGVWHVAGVVISAM